MAVPCPYDGIENVTMLAVRTRHCPVPTVESVGALSPNLCLIECAQLFISNLLIAGVSRR